MKKFGFTLAEVLITLTIIGVIATMVLPSLQSNVALRTIEAATQKFYTTFQQGIKMYMVEQGLDTLQYIDSNDIDSLIKSTFNVESKCETPSACFAEQYRKSSSSGVAHSNFLTASMPAYILEDGMAIQLNSQLVVTVDVNGIKGPNVLNKDLWTLSLSYNGKLNDMAFTDGIKTPAAIKTKFEKCKSGSDEYGCFAHFVQNGFKFDY